MAKLHVLNDVSGNEVLINDLDIITVVSTGASTCSVTYKNKAESFANTVEADIAIEDLVLASEVLFQTVEDSSAVDIALNTNRVKSAQSLDTDLTKIGYDEDGNSLGILTIRTDVSGLPNFVLVRKIVATSTSTTTDFGGLVVGQTVINIPAVAGNAKFGVVATADTLPFAAVVGDLYLVL
jgi:hypothetical protein